MEMAIAMADLIMETPQLPFASFIESYILRCRPRLGGAPLILRDRLEPGTPFR